MAFAATEFDLARKRAMESETAARNAIDYFNSVPAYNTNAKAEAERVAKMYTERAIRDKELLRRYMQINKIG